MLASRARGSRAFCEAYLHDTSSVAAWRSDTSPLIERVSPSWRGARRGRGSALLTARQPSREASVSSGGKYVWEARENVMEANKWRLGMASAAISRRESIIACITRAKRLKRGKPERLRSKRAKSLKKLGAVTPHGKPGASESRHRRRRLTPAAAAERGLSVSSSGAGGEGHHRRNQLRGEAAHREALCVRSEA